MYAIKPNALPEYWQYAYFDKSFSDEECDQIRAFFPEELKEATLGPNGDINESFRKTKLEWLFKNDVNQWVFDKIWDIASKVNDRHWKFQLSGFFEAAQLTKYVDGGHYRWHQDNGPGPLSIRKLSVVLQLSEPTEYEGCELVIQGHEAAKMPKTKGALIICPSFAPHMVTPIISGVRHSLVSWISGEPYR